MGGGEGKRNCHEVYVLKNLYLSIVLEVEEDLVVWACRLDWATLGWSKLGRHFCFLLLLYFSVYYFPSLILIQNQSHKFRIVI